MPLPQIEFEIALGDEVWGRIVLELDDARAPATVANFLQYVDDGFFDGTIFHRVLPTFMIQGGGYSALNQQKSGGLRPPIKNEAAAGLRNDRGVIAMARTGEPHSATSQFFINVVDNDGLNHPAHDGWGYCAFGRVVSGMDVVDRIKSVPTRPSAQMGGEPSQPLTPPQIRKARRLSA